MKKSNWIIIAILFVASCFFLALWYWLDFNLVDDPLDLIVTIVWWALIIAICLVIHFSEKRRQRAIRTVFIAPNLIYNSEVGLVRLNPGEAYVPALGKLISNLEYTFDRAEETQDENGARIRFRYIVHTDKFEDDGDTWEGEVIEVARPDDPHEFSSRQELTRLLPKQA